MIHLYRIIKVEGGEYYRPQKWTLRKGWINLSLCSLSKLEDAKKYIEDSAKYYKNYKVWQGIK